MRQNTTNKLIWQNKNISLTKLNFSHLLHTKIYEQWLIYWVALLSRLLNIFICCITFLKINQKVFKCSPRGCGRADPESGWTKETWSDWLTALYTVTGTALLAIWVNYLWFPATHRSRWNFCHLARKLLVRGCKKYIGHSCLYVSLCAV